MNVKWWNTKNFSRRNINAVSNVYLFICLADLAFPSRWAVFGLAQ
jgi:hypothetical protein